MRSRANVRFANTSQWILFLVLVVVIGIITIGRRSILLPTSHGHVLSDVMAENPYEDHDQHDGQEHPVPEGDVESEDLGGGGRGCR